MFLIFLTWSIRNRLLPSAAKILSQSMPKICREEKKKKLEKKERGVERKIKKEKKRKKSKTKERPRHPSPSSSEVLPEISPLSPPLETAGEFSLVDGLYHSILEEHRLDPYFATNIEILQKKDCSVPLYLKKYLIIVHEERENPSIEFHCLSQKLALLQIGVKEFVLQWERSKVKEEVN